MLGQRRRRWSNVEPTLFLMLCLWAVMGVRKSHTYISLQILHIRCRPSTKTTLECFIFAGCLRPTWHITRWWTDVGRGTYLFWSSMITWARLPPKSTWSAGRSAALGQCDVLTWILADPDGSFVSTGACNLEVPGSNPGRAADICHCSCAYIVLQTVQRPGVFSAA